MFKKLVTIVKSVLHSIKQKPNLLSFIAGLSLVFAYAPFSFWWLPFIALPIWLYQLDKTPHKVQCSYYFALGWFTTGISWVHVSIADFGGMPLVISLLLMFFLCMYLAIYSALATWLTKKLSQIFTVPSTRHQPVKSTDSTFNLWLLAPLWLVGEYLREHVLTGFPWLSLGYSQIDSPLNMLAPIIGEIGISFVMLLLAISFVKIIQQKSIVMSVSTIVIISCTVVIAALQTWVTPTGKTINTALVQGNIEQELKWLPEKEGPTLELYLTLTQQAQATENIDIVVWPESAIPSLEPTIQNYLYLVDDVASEANSAIITGILNYNRQQQSFLNSVIVLGNRNEQEPTSSYSYDHDNRYSKHHLLPIGEFVPFEDWLRPIAPLFNLPMSSFKRGDYQQTNLEAKSIHVLPLLCFEIVFPDQLAANMNDDTQLLLTVSNDAWFADSHGPHQHMDIARMRALEFARPLIRSTNTGITAAVDHYGQYINRLPQFEEDVLISTITLVEGKTPYANHGRTLVYLLALLFTFIVLRQQMKYH